MGPDGLGQLLHELTGVKKMISLIRYENISEEEKLHKLITLVTLAFTLLEQILPRLPGAKVVLAVQDEDDQETSQETGDK